MRIFQKGFHYSQDGPGNRLIYHLQGCNLRCPWCSNPEGLSLEGGIDYPVEELVAEVKRSRMMFFDCGGVTLTGGEVTMQFEEIKELLFRLHNEGIHTCIETNGISPRLSELFPVLDLLIMDIKHYIPEIHKAVTNVSNDMTIRNICAALAANQPLALRIPLIGGFNASEYDAHHFGELLRDLGVAGRGTVELLPYHEYGRAKYDTLNMTYRMTDEAKVTSDQVYSYTKILERYGLTVIKT